MFVFLVCLRIVVVGEGELVVQLIFVVVEAVVGAAPPANDQTVGSTDNSTVGQLAGAFFIIAAGIAERDQSLAEVVAARHRSRL